MTGTIGCVKAATDILGDKWTPQILRCLANAEESSRFCQIQDIVGGVNPRTLSARLTSLEQKGIIEKYSCDTNARCSYRLTKKGRDLVPILQSMQQWSDKYHQTPTLVA